MANDLIVDALRNDGNASKPEQIKRLNPWKKKKKKMTMIMMMMTSEVGTSVSFLEMCWYSFIQGHVYKHFGINSAIPARLTGIFPWLDYECRNLNNVQ